MQRFDFALPADTLGEWTMMKLRWETNPTQSRHFVAGLPMGSRPQ